MKIAIVCPYPLHTSGGVQRHILDYYSVLKNLNHTVHLISPSKPEEINIPDHRSVGKYKVVTGGKILTNGSSTYYTSVSSKDADLGEGYDVIHIHEPLMPAFFYGLRIARASKSKIKIAHIHAYNPFLTETLGFLSLPLIKRLIKPFDRVFCSSKVSAAPYNNSGKPVDIIPNGVIISKLSPDAPKVKQYLDGKINPMFLGRSDERKGLKYLFETWKILVKKYEGKIRLIVAGGRSEEEIELMKSWATDLPFRENISFEGSVTEERKAGLMASSLIFVSPATGSESFGMVLNESMACETPVVAFDNPGYRTVLEGMTDISLAKLLDVNDLAAKISYLIENQDVREDFAKWGLNEVKSKYDWEKLTVRILKIYTNAIAHKLKPLQISN